MFMARGGGRDEFEEWKKEQAKEQKEAKRNDMFGFGEEDSTNKQSEFDEWKEATQKKDIEWSKYKRWKELEKQRKAEAEAKKA